MKKNNFLIDMSNNLFKDDRGSLKVIFNKKLKFFKDFDVKYCFTTFNHSAKTFRGVHFQIYPFSQNKLIILNSGKIIDFIVDLRKTSKSFLKVINLNLSAKENHIIKIPKGFGHAYYTLEKNTSITYFTDEKYNLNCSCGINYKDKSIHSNFNNLDIKHISQKDYSLPNTEDIFNKLRF
jgi:dTDP-4-dehydrorhamnose 3,5-epimerase